MHIFYEAIITGLSCAMIGVTMIVLLANEPILNWWFRFGEWVGKRYPDGREVERWFYKPIWGCEKCFSGQLALWAFLFFHIRTGTAQFCHVAGHAVHYPCFYNYSPFCHALCICTAIMVAVLLTHLINIVTNE